MTAFVFTLAQKNICEYLGSISFNNGIREQLLGTHHDVQGEHRDYIGPSEGGALFHPNFVRLNLSICVLCFVSASALTKMSAENSLSKDMDNGGGGGFRWSFDEIRNIFVRARTSGGERASSQGSFRWSLSGTIDAIRARFSSHERSVTEQTIVKQNAEEPSKKLRMIDDGSNRESRREDRREARRGKSEKEKDRRNNVNNLFYTLGGLLGMEPGVKNKTQILSNAKDYLQTTTNNVDQAGEIQASREQ